METYLGVDIGTTVTKAALFDELGTAVAVAERPTRLERQGLDRVEQDGRPDRANRTLRLFMSM